MSFNWKVIAKVEVASKPVALWTLAVPYLEGVNRLKFEAQGEWNYGGGLCGPDGYRASLLPRDKCLMDKAPVGALIGKLGGSTAGISDGHVFVVGSSCIVEFVADKTPTKGPLYLTINDLLEGFDDNDGKVTVLISDGTQIGESVKS